MYGERSSERANVRVVLYIRQTLPNHRFFPRSGDVIHPQLGELGSGYETMFCRTQVLEN